MHAERRCAMRCTGVHCIVPVMSDAGMWMWADANGENTILSQGLFERVYLALLNDNPTHREQAAQELLKATPPHWSVPDEAGDPTHHGGTDAGAVRDRPGHVAKAE